MSQRENKMVEEGADVAPAAAIPPREPGGSAFHQARLIQEQLRRRQN